MLKTEPSRNPKRKRFPKSVIIEYFCIINLLVWGVLFVYDVIHFYNVAAALDLIITGLFAGVLNNKFETWLGVKS